MSEIYASEKLFFSFFAVCIKKEKKLFKGAIVLLAFHLIGVRKKVHAGVFSFLTMTI